MEWSTAFVIIVLFICSTWAICKWIEYRSTISNTELRCAFNNFQAWWREIARQMEADRKAYKAPSQNGGE